MGSITAVRGFKDILPGEAGKWQHVERTAREMFTAFAFQEIRLPLLEKTELFSRGIGTATDIVEKEMYTFLDHGKEHLTLRPEATASVMRAYIEHSLFASDPVAKLFTIGPMFRRERPQKGRFRQFHQINAEVLGIEDPRCDAEVLFLLMQLLARLQIAGVRLEINSLGDPDCRPAFRAAVKDYMTGREQLLCEDCQRRLTTNPLRIFDCKVPGCREVVAGGPRMLAFLCDACREHFASVTRRLEMLGVPFVINDKMVRGLDYYTRTAFEITTSAAEGQNAVAGGGRYDGLVKELGGPDIPGIGFAVGAERLIALLPGDDADFVPVPDLFLAALGDAARDRAFLLVNRLRLRGLLAEMDYAGKGLKSQMKRADKLRCRYVLVLGDQELEEGEAPLRDMSAGTQQAVKLDAAEETLFDMLKKR
jgi:histidyl-tRNA synthetase